MTKTKTYNIHVRLAPATKEKVDYLARQYGTMSQAIAVAIDRLYRAEQAGDPADQVQPDTGS